MSRSIFGWDLPPGVTGRMIDEAMGLEGPCQVCGRHVDDCICPECSDCGGQGDPRCYDQGHESDYPAASSQLQRNEAQIIGRKLLDEDIPEITDWSGSVRGKFYRGPK